MTDDMRARNWCREATANIEAARPGNRCWWPKQDSRPARGMWCPGEYMCLCWKCKEWFAGDKRSIRCADCAYTPATAI
jgi:hypothetical protein